MDKRQKSALRGAHIELANQLILDEDFYAALRQNKIFTDGMMAIIKAEKNERNRVYKMLELLEKRGPKAFDNFVKVLTVNYDWLAEMLQTEHDRRRCLAQPETYESQHDTVPKYIDTQTSLQSNRTQSMSNIDGRANELTQTQGAYSASLLDRRFFPPHHSNHHQYRHQTGSDYSNNIPQATAGTKLLKDSCTSPIEVIESPRKTRPVTSGQYPRKRRDTDLDFTNQELTRSNSRVSFKNGHQVDHKVIPSYENKQEDGTKTDDLDAFCNVSVGDDDNDDLRSLNDEDDVFPNSEEYYNSIRRESSCLDQTQDESLQTEETVTSDRENIDASYDNIDAANDDDNFDNETLRTESYWEQDPDYLGHIEEMKQLYDKLLTLNSRNGQENDIEEEEMDDVNWDMINNELEKLSSQLVNSDDSKLIQQCYGLFLEKERRKPLNLCIQELKNEMKEMEKVINEKIKEIEQMALDMYNHQQEMKHIEKLKSMKQQLLHETINLHNENSKLTDALQEKSLLINELEKRNKMLEEKLKPTPEKSLSPRRATQVTRRPGQGTLRRPSNATTSNSNPRLSLMQTQFLSPRAGTGYSSLKRYTKR